MSMMVLNVKKPRPTNCAEPYTSFTSPVLPHVNLKGLFGVITAVPPGTTPPGVGIVPLYSPVEAFSVRLDRLNLVNDSEASLLVAAPYDVRAMPYFVASPNMALSAQNTPPPQ